MARTTYRWTRERVVHRLFPLAVAGLWFAAWLSPPGRAAWDWLTHAVPSWALLPIGLVVLTAALTWGTIAFFHRLDVTGKPAFLARFKLQQPFSDPRRPSPGKAARVTLINHALLLPGIALVAAILYWRGWDALAEPGPWWLVLLQLVAMGLITEVSFFAGHRWLHTRWLYKRVHVVHHEFRAPTVWSAQYAHPFEYVVGNVVPLGLPMVIIAPDLLTILCFAVLALLNTQLVHSGYQLPLAPWSVPHDLHHYRVTVNYGSLGLMDRLFGSRLRRLPPGHDVEMGTDVAGVPEATRARRGT